YVVADSLHRFGRVARSPHCKADGGAKLFAEVVADQILCWPWGKGALPVLGVPSRSPASWAKKYSSMALRAVASLPGKFLVRTSERPLVRFAMKSGSKPFP